MSFGEVIGVQARAGRSARDGHGGAGMEIETLDRCDCDAAAEAQVRGEGISSSILATIGRTPLIPLRRLALGLSARILAKVESLNPGGSIKDRVGVAMVEEAERRGWLRPGGTIIEATAGDTGVGLALAAAVKG